MVVPRATPGTRHTFSQEPNMRHHAPPSVRRTVATLVAFIGALTLVAGCGSDDGDNGTSSSADAAKTRNLVVYSGREKELAEPIYEAFTKETGIEVEARFADSAALAAQLQEEGDRSPADVFYAQDAGVMGAVSGQLAKLPADSIKDVAEQLRDSDGRWAGVTARARVLAYNTEEVKEGDLPTSVLDMTDPRWKGMIGVAPTNASFIAFVSALRLQVGDAAARKFLEGLKANDARIYEKNGAIVDAVGSGEIKVGLVNHYYLYEKLGVDADLPIANHYFAPGDTGSFVNVSAVGILESAEHSDEAQEFVEFLLGSGQELVVTDLAEREYPVIEAAVADNERYQELPPLDELLAEQEIALSELGAELEATVALIDEVGLGA